VSCVVARKTSEKEKTMLLLKYMFLAASIGLFAGAAVMVAYDLYQALEKWRQKGEGPPEPVHVRWKEAGKLAGLAWLPLLAGLSIVVVPSGQAGVRVSQFSGTLHGTLYPGVHLATPLVERIVLYDVRDRIFTTAPAADSKKKIEVLTVHTKEGLAVGLAIAVRYRIDPSRLDYVHSSLPQPLEEELVPPVVASVFRQVAPNYEVREVFSAKREEVRQRAAEAITKRLATDAILVKEVMLRDIVLPAEYAKGLEGLLLKEQESERLSVELEVKQKMVREAELEAEAQKVRQVKQAEGQSQVTVLQAKAQADAMQYTLPLKEKQIQQTRLEAEARKEATLKNAEASAQAKVIDSKAELERRNLMAEAEDRRIRLVAGADAERMKSEAQVLKQNPLLIQKIIAERLSDKVQIMMVPTDGKFFFANDVLRSPMMTLPKAEDPDPASATLTVTPRAQR
jgi:regulator of protease activity HflC (stomatin/prohibitin superfamily)